MRFLTAIFSHFGSIFYESNKSVKDALWNVWLCNYVVVIYCAVGCYVICYLQKLKYQL